MSDGHHSVSIRVLKVDTTRSFAELTDQDAVAEGFQDREECGRDLKKSVIRGSPTAILVSVIYFEQANSSSASA